MNYNYQSICREVCVIAREVGDFIRQERKKFTPSHVEIKGEHNFVSYVDKTAEQKIVDALSKIIPESGCIAEENTSDKEGDVYNWVIDPLDGTTNFIHGIPCFSVSIALMAKDEVVVGVVYEVNLDECFYAYKGSKAFMNGQEISVTKANKLNDSLIATGFPYYDYRKMNPYLNLFASLMQHTRGLRRLGSAAVDLAYVACGRFEAFYEYGLNPWDVAAGTLIVQQAGGKVTDFKGDGDFVFGKEIIASNGLIHPEFLTIVKKYF